MRKILKASAAIVLALCLLLSTVTASAVGVIKETGDVPYDTYTYWNNANTVDAVRAKGMYDFDKYVPTEKIADGNVTSLSDISFDSEDNMYLLDGLSSKIYVYDDEYNYSYTIGDIIAEDGTAYHYEKALGMYVSKAGKIYICDTENARVLISDKSGKLLDVLLLPNSNLIPEELLNNYRPFKITVDSSDYVYILSEGSYYGALLYSPNGDFLSFFGANTVLASVTQALKTIWNKLTMTDAKLAQTERRLPFQFVDLYADNQDFVYTVTGKTSNNGVEKGQLKRMSPGGINILESTNVTFGLNSGVRTMSAMTYGDLVSVAVNDDNFMFAVDISTGGIFIYNDDCDLLNAFGGGSVGDSDQIGIAKTYRAIDVNSKNDIVIVDEGKISFSVFKINEYGKLVFEADVLTRRGDYENARPAWLQVLKNDRNSQVAYSGLARTYFASGEYEEAQKYAKMAFDNDTYSAAFEYVRRDFLEDYIYVIAFVILAIVAIILVAKYLIKKKGIVLVKNEEISLLKKVTFHPNDVFADVKHKNKGSVYIGVALIVIYYISAVAKQTLSGHLFKSPLVTSFNSLMVLVQTLGLVLLWTICNWAVCTLMSGKGKMREIFIVTSYSLVPLIIGNVVYTIASNFMLESEASFLGIFMTIMTMLTAFILIMGTVTIHDYTFGEFVGTSILTILGILIVIFLFISVFILVQQTYSFLATIFREIVYR